MNTPTQGTDFRVRDIRSLPFFWIQRALLDEIKPTWKGLIAYNALAYFAAGNTSKCKDVSVRKLADRVGVSEDTMRRGIEELSEKKAIKINFKYHKNKGKRTQLPNVYTLIDIATTRTQPI